MIKRLTHLLLFFLSPCVLAQLGIGTSTPSTEAILDIFSTNSGVLISRIELQNTPNCSPLTCHVAGMIVYNTATSGTGNSMVTPGFYYNDGSQWVRLEPLTTANGDIKQSLLTEDHNGWYLMDGRSIASLPGNAASNALLAGFTVNLPNATDRFLKGKSGAESLGAIGGTTNRNLTQSHLPNVTFSGTAGSAGSHTHDYEDKYHGVSENLNLVTGLLGILSGVVLNIMNNNVGSDTVAIDTGISSTNGSHTHTATVTTGGSASTLPAASHMVANTFVYLGK
ncbi:hypothetical protein [Flavobacterium sp. GCM10023249]|uniref:hypothetical protein n=1 Tax=unclassified Flavobacterium TaxID=196869 RepID=UPI0036177382